jgi:hypothetical protein
VDAKEVVLKSGGGGDVDKPKRKEIKLVLNGVVNVIVGSS